MVDELAKTVVDVTIDHAVVDDRAAVGEAAGIWVDRAVIAERTASLVD